jgi:AcrR family transcriptional regulator
MPRLSSEQQQSRRNRILDAAELCFAQQGFHRTTMHDICAKAGISAGALYVYFESKEQLIEGLTERDREEFLGHFATFGNASDFNETLFHLFENCVANQPPHKAILWMEICAEATRNPTISQTHKRFKSVLRQSVVQLVTQAAVHGRITPSMPVEEAVNAILMITDGFFCQKATDPDFDLIHSGEQLLTLLKTILHPTSPVTDHPIISMPEHIE